MTVIYQKTLYDELDTFCEMFKNDFYLRQVLGPNVSAELVDSIHSLLSNCIVQNKDILTNCHKDTNALSNSYRNFIKKIHNIIYNEYRTTDSLINLDILINYLVYRMLVLSKIEFHHGYTEQFWNLQGLSWYKEINSYKRQVTYTLTDFFEVSINRFKLYLDWLYDTEQDTQVEKETMIFESIVDCLEEASHTYKISGRGVKFETINNILSTIEKRVHRDIESKVMYPQGLINDITKYCQDLRDLPRLYIFICNNENYLYKEW